jgi:hypothetical protein
VSINETLKAIACHPGPRRERLAAVVKENLTEIPVVIIPNHAPATNNHFYINDLASTYAVLTKS